MTIRDHVIQTGSIALAGDLFRFAEPGAWIRAPTYADANDDTGSHHSHGLHRPCGRFVPLRGTGRVGTRPYVSVGTPQRRVIVDGSRRHVFMLTCVSRRTGNTENLPLLQWVWKKNLAASQGSSISLLKLLE